MPRDLSTSEFEDHYEPACEECECDEGFVFADSRKREIIECPCACHTTEAELREIEGDLRFHERQEGLGRD